MKQITLYEPESQKDCILIKDCEHCVYYQEEKICPEILNRWAEDD